MFNWTTTTILNSLTDYTNPDLTLVSAANNTLRIKRAFIFEKQYIEKIRKATAADPTLFQLTIDLKTLVEKLALGEKDVYGTLAFYIGLEGSEESIYANDWYQKGRPFSIGFGYEYDAADKADGTAKATAMATTIAANAKKYGIMTFGKRIFSLEANNTALILKGAHEYQRIMKAAVITDDGIYDKFIYTYEDNGTATQGIFTLDVRGTNGFGTYTQLVKDLRLPTPEHTKFYQVMADETPIPGAKYNQYIITYCAPSLANPGFGVIGERHEKTETTHVFWVNQAIDAQFMTYINAIGATIVTGKNDATVSVTPDADVTPDSTTGSRSAGYKNAGKDLKAGTADDVTLG